ncbi:MAG: hypothetical protein NWE93_05920 [Candidatus Bathyarchaeota archaeon]|nr:hypothetical protein [Candidatus Bathyarchaeota archaeon]
MYVEARAIEVRIQNEPFTSFTIQDDSGNTWNVNYLYNIRWKGHFEQDWTEVSYPSDGYLRSNSGSESVFSIIGGEYSSSEGLKLYINGWQSSYTVGAQIDVQVEAMIGYVHRVFENGGFPYVFTGETSGWSGTQTLTITDTAPMPAPSSVTVDPSDSPQSPTQTPLEPNVGTSVLFGLDWVGIAVIVLLGAVVVLLVLVVVSLRRRG